jgi:membrane-associated protease RseP (regulator of RpoE activity)
MQPEKPESPAADPSDPSPERPSPPVVAELVDGPPNGPPPGLEFGIPVIGEISRQSLPALRPRYQRRIILPVILFVVTCVSTFLAGSGVVGFHAPIWSDGLIYMGSIMAILLAHEMGHFVQAVRYHVPASLPYFLPMPISPIGTMGAVISMRGSNADRKELFDIGLTGPLAGLVVAIPIVAYGVSTAEAVPLGVTIAGHYPESLLVKFFIWLMRPDLTVGQQLSPTPLLQAGWVGLFITGLNMIPVSQLDGGHVAYALFGRNAHLLARLVVLAALLFIFTSGGEAFGLLVMVALVLFIGVAHPPTADDTAPLGRGRRLIGLLSLAIPILCLSGLPTFR